MKLKISIFIYVLLFVNVIFAQTTRKFELDAGNQTNTLSTKVYIPTGKLPKVIINEGHSAYVNSAEYVNNGKYIFSASKGEVKIWESETGNLIKTFKSIDFPYDKLYTWDCIAPVFSPDGKYFAYQSEKENKIKIVTVRTGEERIVDSFKDASEYAIEQIPDDGYISFSPNGEHIAVSKNCDINIYSINNLNKECTFNGFSVCKKTIFSPDGTVLLGVSKNRIDIWDFASKKLIDTILNISLYDGNAIAISSNNRYVAFYVGEYISVYDISKHKIIQNLERFSMVFDMKFNSDNNLYTIEHDWLNTHYGCINEWNVTTGKKISSTEADGIAANHISFSPDGDVFILSSTSAGQIDLYSTKTKKKISSIGLIPNKIEVCYMPEIDGFSIVNNHKSFCIFDNKFHLLKSGNLKNIFGKTQDYDVQTPSYNIKNSGIYGISNSNEKYAVSYYDFKTEKLKPVLSLDGDALSFTTNKNKLFGYGLGGNAFNNFLMYDVSRETSQFLYQLQSSDREYQQKIAISPSGKFIIVDCKQEATAENGHTSEITEIFDSSTGRKITTLSPKNAGWKIHFDTYNIDIYGGHVLQESICRFSSDERYCIFSYGGTPTIYDTSNWKLVYTCDETYIAYISNNGKYVACRDWNDKLAIYDWKANRKIYEYPITENFVDFSFCDNDTKFVTLSYGGILRIYDVKSGNLLASTITDEAGDYLTYTPEGYFTGSTGGINKFVHLVDGMQVFELGQLYDTLYRPDLVQAKLEGKNIGKPVLKDIVATGDAPRVQFVGTPMATSRTVKLEFSVQDTGGGIGYVYLSQNGKAIQVSKGEESKTGRKFVYSCKVTLAKGENVFEAYAANSANKIESRHISTTLNWQGKVESANLYVLAMGVDKYAKMPQNNLKYSVSDATGIIETFKTSPGGLYGSVNVMTLLDSDVNKANIQKAFETFAVKVKPDDMFILHIAGHGVNYDGEYYYLPADTFAKTDADFVNQGISKHYLTENLSKISSLNTVILLDTCYSGAFIDAKATGNELAQKTALEHLAHTSGQVILTASANSQTANEGYKGHGIFTYAIMEALSGKANYNADSTLSIKEISQYIGYEIPNIYEKMGQSRQSPWNSPIRGDFSVVAAGKKQSAPYFVLSPDGQAHSDSAIAMRIDDSSVAAYTNAVKTERKSNSSSASRTRQHSRAKGIYLTVGNANGAFFDGTDIGVQGYFFGGKHLFAGLDCDLFFTDISSNYTSESGAKSIFFFTADAVAGLSANIKALRPYVAGGIGFYTSSVDNENDSSPSGFAMEGMAGLDITFSKFVLGGMYRLKKLNGAGYIDNFSVCLGWNW